MDPRHPELAIERMVDLMTRFNLITRDIKHSMTSAQISQLEREGGLVVQEICLVAPRLHEAMMQTSRQRRHDLSHGVVEKPVEKEEESTLVPPSVEKFIEKQKKTTRKKKTTKKADK